MVILLKVLFWPVITVISAFLCLCIKGGDPWRLARKGRFTQLKEVLYLGFWNGLVPEQYYALRFYLFARDEWVEDFLTGNEIKQAIRSVSSRSSADLVNNKWQLTRHLQQLNIPVVSNLAVFTEGTIREAKTGDRLPTNSLYFKPVDGFCGRGIERWDYQSTSGQWHWEGRLLAEPELLQHFKTASKRETYVMQEALQNHESVAPLSWGGLITIRVMTVLGREEEPDVVGAHLLIPRSGAVVNHGASGGLNAKLDIPTKRLMWCFRQLPFAERLTVHPDTGIRFEGFEIKSLEAVIDLAKKAHQATPGIFSIGWDIVVSNRGVLILEANTQWGIVTGMWMGRTRFVRRYLDLWLEREREKGSEV